MSSIVKSFSFPKGETRGDTFYIKHGVDSFTVIDCYLLTGSDYPENNRQKEIIDEIVEQSEGKIRRFISTHPDHDHIAGIEELFRRWPTDNFYAVANNVPLDENDASLSKYIQLKKEKNYAIKQGIKRCWLNDDNGIEDPHKASGIHFLWPDLNNEKFKAALKVVEEGGKKNNISPILTYTINGGAKYMWMGDLETGLQTAYYETFKSSIPHVNILFQPHHGRTTGAVPDELLKLLKPQLIIIGNAPSEYIDYGDSQKTITQNTSGDLLFENEGEYVHIYSQNKVDNLPDCLENLPLRDIALYKGTPNYCGSLKLK